MRGLHCESHEDTALLALVYGVDGDQLWLQSKGEIFPEFSLDDITALSLVESFRVLKYFHIVAGASYLMP